MPGTAFRTVRVFTDLTLRQGFYYYHRNLTYEETETQEVKELAEHHPAGKGKI